MELTGKWRKSRRRAPSDGHGGDGSSLPTRDDFRPLDTREQLELVSSFESQHARQSRLWRGVFAAFLLFFAGFLVYSIFQQAQHPWELRYHAYFMDDVDSWMVISADCAAVLACLIAVKGLLRDKSSDLRWLHYSCYIGACLAIFWLYHMLRLPRFRWDIIWLPLGPFSGALLCLYVEHLLAESLEDIRKLRGSVYYYKTS
uniref:Putative membrane protein YGR016W n=1 Tax=Anthurium amnicola TaxID=1678845 RepID=A0A1D1XQI7_9ARAE